MTTMTPAEQLDAQIAVVQEHLIGLLSNIPLAHWLDEGDVDAISQDFINQAHKYIVTNMDERMIVRAIVMTVWDQANERARQTLTEMSAGETT